MAKVQGAGQLVSHLYCKRFDGPTTCDDLLGYDPYTGQRDQDCP